jgi:hypothetical protein
MLAGKRFFVSLIQSFKNRRRAFKTQLDIRIKIFHDWIMFNSISKVAKEIDEI